MCNSTITPFAEDVKHLQMPLYDISLATNGFAYQNLIAKGGFGNVYKGVSEEHGDIAVKRLEHGQGQGDHEFRKEIALLSKYKHENIVSLLGFCDDDGEKILVYEYESNGSLDKHLSSEDLTWIQRLQICLDVVGGLMHVHDNNWFHRDVKSSNILLDAKYRAKISDFGLSRVGCGDMQSSFVISNPCGTQGYIDPDYQMNGYLTAKSDVYSLGVVLWEVLCGRHARVRSYKDERRNLTVLAQKHYKKGTLESIIPSHLQKQIKPASLDMFSSIAYECLKNVEERPTMKQVVEQLQEALDLQLNPRTSLSIEEMKHLHIPLQDLLLATNGFDNTNLTKIFASWKLYRGISEKHGHIFICRLDRDHKFNTTIVSVLEGRYRNIVPPLGFCDEGGEKILVYKDERNRSLHNLNNKDLTWSQQLQISIDIGTTFSSLHYSWLSRIFRPKSYNLDIFANHDINSTNPCGKPGYIDSDYFTNGDRTQKSDVYSYGVGLWKFLCGRRVTSDKDDPQSLINLVQEHYKNQTLHSIIPSKLLKQINKDSLITFSNIAFQCLNKEEVRPTMKQVVEQLQKALDQQLLSDCSSHEF